MNRSRYIYLIFLTNKIYDHPAIAEASGGLVKEPVLAIRAVVRLLLRSGLDVVVVAWINNGVAEDEERPRRLLRGASR